MLQNGTGTVFDTSRIRGLIIARYHSIANFSRAIGKKAPYVSLKLSGKRDFSREEMYEWIKVLEIAPYDIPLYFFTFKVDEKRNEIA